jgi:uncharacterized protein with ParB-like and HNH nuclease domain
MNFTDIPQFSRASYGVDVPLNGLEAALERYIELGLQIEPDFQRHHVWTEEQQERFVEFLLRGGRSGRTILFNHPGWMGSFEGEFVLVDGLQRLTACLRFLRGEIRTFGLLISDFEGHIPFQLSLCFEVNNLKTKREVLQWYVDLNSGGTVHSPEEIAKVKAMIEQAG